MRRKRRAAAEGVERVADATDVATTIRFARDTGLDLAVRAGSHSILGHSSIDGGVVIDLTSLKDIDIELENNILTIRGEKSFELTGNWPSVLNVKKDVAQPI